MCRSNADDRLAAPRQWHRNSQRRFRLRIEHASFAARPDLRFGSAQMRAPPIAIALGHREAVIDFLTN
ncbi:hypothetical protein OH687_06105 [Burkholderia anthina]|nr:hypothetical protein OH687_06105 [Burkholderia anthina]